MGIKNGLVEEFNNELKEVGKLEVGSEKHKAAVESLTKLADRVIEIDKLEASKEEKLDEKVMEMELRNRQMDDEKKDRWTRNVIEGVKVVGGFGLAAWAFVGSMNFEKTGHIFSTEGGKSSLRQLLKFIK